MTGGGQGWCGGGTGRGAGFGRRWGGRGRGAGRRGGRGHGDRPGAPEAPALHAFEASEGENALNILMERTASIERAVGMLAERLEKLEKGDSEPATKSEGEQS